MLVWGLGLAATVLLVSLAWFFVWSKKTDFYLYFSDETQAQPVVDHLKRKGFRVSSRLSADETQWLILATRRVNPFELDYLEDSLNSLATSHGGEYDGYERRF